LATILLSGPVNNAIRDTMIYDSIINSGRKFFAVLVDPEFHTPRSAAFTGSLASDSGADLILVGGSLTSCPVDDIIKAMKKASTCPVVLFPGNLFQISGNADGILLNSLISGRNPDYLIGNHVLISKYLKKSNMEIIPTGYILTGNHQVTSVEYISNTRPVPPDKTDIISSTALAGEQLGMKLIYLEAGSGAIEKVSEEAVASVCKSVTIPVIAGGGIKSSDDVRALYKAGAAGVVVGTAIEENLGILFRLARVKDEFNPG